MNKYSSEGKPSNEELIELIQKEAAKLGRTPIMKEFKYSSLACYRYGGWNKFLQCADLKAKEFKPRRNKLSNEQLAELVLEKTSELGRPPTMDEFSYGSLARRRYGNWGAFLESVGLEAGKVHRKSLSGEELIQSIQEQASEMGQTPTMTEFSYTSMAIKRFGTWNTFLAAADLEPRRIMEDRTDDELIEWVQAKAVELGRAPTQKEFKHGNSVVRRFGNWTNFLVRAGLKKEP